MLLCPCRSGEVLEKGETLRLRVVPVDENQPPLAHAPDDIAIPDGRNAAVGVDDESLSLKAVGMEDLNPGALSRLSPFAVECLMGPVGFGAMGKYLSNCLIYLTILRSAGES